MTRQPRLHIFDADGTLRWTTVPGQPCPNRRDEWKLMPNVSETLRALPWRGGETKLGIASNQGGVAFGYLTREAAHALLVDMVVEAIGYVPAATAIELCTCVPQVDCDCRKPRPGMLLRIMKRLATPPEETLFVGDLPTDREAALRAGVAFMWADEFFGWNKNPK